MGRSCYAHARYIVVFQNKSCGQLAVGRRPHCRSVSRYNKDALKVNMKQCGLDPSTLSSDSQDRSSWRTLCCEAVEQFEKSRDETSLSAAQMLCVPLFRHFTPPTKYPPICDEIVLQRRLNLGRNDAFCVIGNVGGTERCCHEVRFEISRWIKMRLRRGSDPRCVWGREEGIEMAGEGQGRERKGKEREKGEGECKFGDGVFAPLVLCPCCPPVNGCIFSAGFW